jgi:hypothetical protein
MTEACESDDESFERAICGGNDVSGSAPSANRAAQTGVFELDIRISNPLFIDVCTSFAAETGLKCRNVEKRINGV